MSYSKPIGVFDSGLGGISVLKALVRELRSEDFIYLADKHNAPYGAKTDEEIVHLTQVNAKKLISLDCKALVIACNTATSVAASILRAELDIPVIGLEPAILPAALKHPNGKILVLATPVTLTHDKFRLLLLKIGKEKFTCIQAPYLVEFVESGMKNREDAVSYLKSIFAPYRNLKFDACVLGCTHFPFLKEEIVLALGYHIEFFDGAFGAARYLKNTLQRKNLLNTNEENGKITWLEKYDNDLHNMLFYNKL